MKFRIDENIPTRTFRSPPESGEELVQQMDAKATAGLRPGGFFDQVVNLSFQYHDIPVDPFNGLSRVTDGLPSMTLSGQVIRREDGLGGPGGVNQGVPNMEPVS
jgi:hypothetical protein